MSEDKDNNIGIIAVNTPYRFYCIGGEVVMTHNGVATVIDIDDDDEEKGVE